MILSIFALAGLCKSCNEQPIFANPQSLLMAGKVNMSFEYWKADGVYAAGGMCYYVICRS